MFEKVLALLGVIGLGLLTLNGSLWVLQPSMVFFPTRVLQTTPQDWGLDYEDVTLRTADGVSIHGWFIPHPQASHTLLFFHGNAGNISHRQQSVAIFNRLGLNVFIIDYRGYGQSSGAPSEAGLDLDADAAWRHLTEERGQPPHEIILFGRSLGATVATNLAEQVAPAALILESGFTSARDMARHLYPGLHHVLYRRFALDVTERLPRVSAPVLILHSPDDEIVPYALGRRLYELAPEPKRFVELVGSHNGGFLASQPDYERQLADFIATLQGPFGARQPPAHGSKG